MAVAQDAHWKSARVKKIPFSTDPVETKDHTSSFINQHKSGAFNSLLLSSDPRETLFFTNKLLLFVGFSEAHQAVAKLANVMRDGASALLSPRATAMNLSGSRTLLFLGLLLLLIVATASGYILLAENSGMSARRINLAGRQRMLAQKFARDALLLAAGGSPRALAPLANALAVETVEWEQYHNALVAGHAGLELSPKAEVQEIQQLRAMEPLAVRHLDQVRRIAANATSAGQQQAYDPAALRKLTTVTDQLVAALDEYVRLNVEQEQARQHTNRVALTLMLGLAMALSLLAVFMYRSQSQRASRSREEIESLLHILQQTSEGIAILDSNFLLQWVNPAFCSMTGYRAEQLHGQDLRLHASKQHDESYNQEMVRTLMSGKVWRHRIQVKRQDGAEYTADQTFTPAFNPTGGVRNFVVTQVDVTETAALEERLRHSEKLEAVGALAGGIAHDFNNLLTPILGFSELALINSKESPQAQEHLLQIITAATRARELTRKILIFSRRRQAVPVSLDLSVVLHEVLNLLRATLPPSLNINYSIAPELPHVHADPGELNTLLLNLCINANHAMPSGGNLTLALDSIPAAGTAGPGQVRLTVADTGTGMDAATQARAFEPFFTTKAPGTGTGLGLATVKSIVERAHGRIELATALGKGTTFTILLPAAAPSASAAAVTKPGADLAPLKGRSILVVDDNPDVLRSTAERLRALGCSVTALENPQAALDLILRGPGACDLLLTDHSMPGLSGVLLSVKAREAQPHLAVVLMTGKLDEGVQMLASGAGITHFLPKPFSQDELSRVLTNALPRPQQEPGREAESIRPNLASSHTAPLAKA